MNRRLEYWIAIFSFVFFLFYPGGYFYNLIGDNLCQIAYWKILVHDHLKGSVAASTPKPGLMLLLGITPISLYKGLISVFAALFVVSVYVSTARLAGGLAGGIAAALLLSNNEFLSTYQTGNSMLFFLPLLVLGVYFTAWRSHLLLFASGLVRIEAIAVHATLIARAFLRDRDWRKAVLSSLLIPAVIAAYFVVTYLVMGSMDRMDPGSASAGYIFSKSRGLTLEMIQTIWTAVIRYTVESIRPLGMLFPAMFAVLFVPASRRYLSLAAIVPFMLLYWGLGSGAQNIRYFAFWMPVALIMGMCGIVRAWRMDSQALVSRRGLIFALSTVGLLLLIYATQTEYQKTYQPWVFIQCVESALVIPVVMGAAFLTRIAHKEALIAAVIGLSISARTGLEAVRSWKRSARTVNTEYADYVKDGLALLQNTSVVPTGSRVLMEDDMTYVVILRDPHRFEKILPLQYFNTLSPERRSAVLSGMDYIVVSRRSWDMYFLRYLPLDHWGNDPFRRAVEKVLRGGTSEEYMRFQLELKPDTQEQGFAVIKVENTR